jgi:hypothetical protein
VGHTEGYAAGEFAHRISNANKLASLRLSDVSYNKRENSAISHSRVNFYWPRGVGLTT